MKRKGCFFILFKNLTKTKQNKKTQELQRETQIQSLFCFMVGTFYLQEETLLDAANTCYLLRERLLKLHIKRLERSVPGRGTAFPRKAEEAVQCRENSSDPSHTEDAPQQSSSVTRERPKTTQRRQPESARTLVSMSLGSTRRRTARGRRGGICAYVEKEPLCRGRA